MNSSANIGDHDSYGWPDNYYILSSKAKNGVRIVPRAAGPPELSSPEDMIINTSYVISKVGLIAMTRIQQRQFDRDRRIDLVVNCVHPGFVDTDMSSHKGPVNTAEGSVKNLVIEELLQTRKILANSHEISKMGFILLDTILFLPSFLGL